MIYIYDGTFDGFLTCIYQNYYDAKATKIYRDEAWQMNVLEEHLHITTDPDKATRVYKGLHDRLSEKALEEVFYAFLSNDSGKENYLMDFIRLAFKVGIKIDSMYSHAAVLPIREIVQRVMSEKHRFMGILRFKDTGSCLYAEYAPDHNITGLLAPFFCERLANERFIIHDVRRKIAAVYYKKWYLTDFELSQPLSITSAEVEIAALWQHYFDTAAVESRINPRLQRSCLPRRYWRFLTEMQHKSKPYSANIVVNDKIQISSFS